MAQPLTEQSDEALVAACLKGEVAAFEVLVRRHQKRQLNIALRVVGDYDEACEVVQDALLAAYRGLASFRGTARFTTWLTTITVNLSRNRLTKIKDRRHQEAYSLNTPLPGQDCAILPDPPSPAPSVQERLEERELRQQVQRCIGALAADYRQVLVLRDMEEFSYEEIGAMLRLAAGTVKSRLFRAREAIKECLKRTVGSL
jgi:RNA polymerase sigma-70 factor, ECF subfamily